MALLRGRGSVHSYWGIHRAAELEGVDLVSFSVDTSGGELDGSGGELDILTHPALDNDAWSFNMKRTTPQSATLEETGLHSDARSSNLQGIGMEHSTCSQKSITCNETCSFDMQVASHSWQSSWGCPREAFTPQGDVR